MSDTTDLKARLRETQDDWPAALVKLEHEAADALDAKDARIAELERDSNHWRHTSFSDMARACQQRERAQAAERERDEALAEVERLKGLLWYGWSEMNAIRAESGVPRDYDGRRKAISEDHWSNIVDAMADALGEDATPWPSEAARQALATTTQESDQPYKCQTCGEEMEADSTWSDCERLDCHMAPRSQEQKNAQKRESELRRVKNFAQKR